MTETFTSELPGLVAAVYDFHGVQTRTLLLRGLYLVEVVEIENDAPVPASRVTFSFTDPPGGLPDPAAGGGWSGAVTMLTGDIRRTETRTVTFGPPGVLELGACRYVAIEVRLDYPDRSPPGYEVMTWLPALGFGFLSGEGHGPSGTTAVAEEDYDYMAIEALP